MQEPTPSADLTAMVCQAFTYLSNEFPDPEGIAGE